jgi:hypothetical protein
MKVIDKILNEWSFRCHDGIVDMNDPIKLSILNEVLEEYNISEEEETTTESDSTIQPTTTENDVQELKKIFTSISEDYAKYLAVFSLFDPNSLGTISEVLLAKLIENKGIETVHTGGFQGVTDLIINNHRISLTTTSSKNKIGLGSSREETDDNAAKEISSLITKNQLENTPIESLQDKPLECPVSVKGRSKFKMWMKRIGVAGFLFFLIKGLIWIGIFLFAKDIISK